MQFEAIPRKTVILDPANQMAPIEIPIEIRKDPLTGRTSRICHFRELKWEKPDFDKLISGTESWCPFCPEKVMQVTPCFPEEVVPGGRMTAADKVLFPNIAPYDRLGAVATMGNRHYIPMTQIEPQRITDTFQLAMRFFQHLQNINHPESVYHLISWNYMPAAGSSIIHPHLQVFATAWAPNLLRIELEAAEAYLQKNGTNYWDALVETEITQGERFLGRIGRSHWLMVYAPVGVAGDVIAVVDGVRGTLELKDNDLSDLALGLTLLMAAYDKMGIYNFNMSFFPGAAGDDFARFHIVFSPRTYFNPTLATPDTAALKHLYQESVCMEFPEEIRNMLKSEF